MADRYSNYPTRERAGNLSSSQSKGLAHIESQKSVRFADDYKNGASNPFKTKDNISVRSSQEKKGIIKDRSPRRERATYNDYNASHGQFDRQNFDEFDDSIQNLEKIRDEGKGGYKTIADQYSKEQTNFSSKNGSPTKPAVVSSQVAASAFQGYQDKDPLDDSFANSKRARQAFDNSGQPIYDPHQMTRTSASPERRPTAQFRKAGETKISNQLDEIPEKENPPVAEFNANDFQSDEFHKIYHEHLKEKERIRNKIEAMQREKGFLEQLNTNDVAYMFQKKYDAELKQDKEKFDNKYKTAKEPTQQQSRLRDLSPESRKKALQSRLEVQGIQRMDTLVDFRECKHQERTKEVQQTVDESKLSKPDKLKLDRQRDQLKNFRQRDMKKRNESDMFGPIPEETVKELRQKVQLLLQENNHKCLHGHGHAPEEIDFKAKDKEFEVRFEEFMHDQSQAENDRQESQHHLHDMAIMEHYLIDEKHADQMISNSGFNPYCNDNIDDRHLLHQIGKEINIKKDDNWYKPEYDETGQRKFNIDIRDIKVWTDISGGVLQDHWQACGDAHVQKLNNFRQKRRYENWLEDDEEDVEAEKIYSEIKNLSQEKFFNLYFNHEESYSQAISDQRSREEHGVNLSDTIKLKDQDFRTLSNQKKTLK